MRQVLTRASLVTMFAATAVSGAHADTIRIVAGTLIWDGTTDNVDGSSADLNLRGQQGFTFEASTGFGRFGPTRCATPECLPGTMVDLDAFWSGADLDGIATLRGQTYTEVGVVGGSASMSAEWSGGLTIPAGFSGGSLEAPFLFSGSFTYLSGPNDEISRLGLRGGGTATLSFSPFPNEPGFFRLDSARYDFSAAPVPEPATFMLVGLGAAGMARARSKRRSV